MGPMFGSTTLKRCLVSSSHQFLIFLIALQIAFLQLKESILGHWFDVTIFQGNPKMLSTGTRVRIPMAEFDQYKLKNCHFWRPKSSFQGMSVSN